MTYKDDVRSHPRSVFTYRRGRKPTKAGFNFKAGENKVNYVLYCNRDILQVRLERGPRVFQTIIIKVCMVVKNYQIYTVL